VQVSEIFYSIQGETSYAGRPCMFVRLAGCNLDCSYCDTRYARHGGTPMSVDSIVQKVAEHPVRLVMVTGGEPLLQDETPELIRRLNSSGHLVLVETNGSLDIGVLPDEVIRIVDMKCPDSGMADRMLMANLERVGERDEVKFVISTRKDYLWAKELMLRYSLPQRTTVLLSPAHGVLEPRDLAEWILEDHLECVLQLQLHKILWPGNQRGV
jgi:7-carboxy-7-deazaguanine synthase